MPCRKSRTKPSKSVRTSFTEGGFSLETTLYRRIPTIKREGIAFKWRKVSDGERHLTSKNDPRILIFPMGQLDGTVYLAFLANFKPHPYMQYRAIEEQGCLVQLGLDFWFFLLTKETVVLSNQKQLVWRSLCMIFPIFSMGGHETNHRTMYPPPHVSLQLSVSAISLCIIDYVENTIGIIIL